MANPSQLYLNLMKKCLTFMIYGDRHLDIHDEKKRGVLNLVRAKSSDLEARAEGHDWPDLAHTMIGLKRLENLQFCVESVLADNVPGDLIETGVWRGGASIFMRAILAAYDVKNRDVWVADSFEGLPRPNPKKYPSDSKDLLHTINYLSVTLEEVKSNFRTYELLDNQVRFVKGWFRDTLPKLLDHKWAVIRLDGDMYESTMDALTSLYPNLSVGGYAIVDDYVCLDACRQAVSDYREAQGIKEEIQVIDWSGAFWRRTQE